MSSYRFEAVCRAYPNVVTLDGDNDAWDAEGNVVELDESAIEAVFATVANEQGFKSLRYKRDKLLAATDWWATSDRTMTAEQTAYRQALRDLPANTTDPANPVWPTKP